MNKLVGSLKYRDLRYTQNHPLRIPRVSLLIEFLKAMGLIEEQEIIQSREATKKELLLYHTEDYLRALEESDRCMCVKDGYREKYNIGTYENPVSPAMWRGSLLATGSSLQAAQIFLEGGVAFNPAGGMHHAYPNRANGFCFINDPAVSIEFLKKKGFKKILYIDLDAHHCDAIQEYYYEDDSVFVLSLHQSPEYAFPFKSGFVEEMGRGRGKGYNMNVPLPKGVKDGEYLYALEESLKIVKEIFSPDVYILQLGTDSLKEDYLSKFELSNAGFLKAFDMVREAFGEGIYLGGGGYHPIALARAWTLIWCRISGREIPSKINSEARQVLLSVNFEEFDEDINRTYMYEHLLDRSDGEPPRGEVKRLIERLKALFLL
ncbi:MAG: acetoin utilization protein AcuC [Hydrogenobacter thermophilus]|uniref:acetoin utilization protein AcuC n=1 Tax=Hydrogenobacter thermophilus TaxID=940 RepID=UPI001C75C5A3|nr:acetoin utilization protein AcuC [Hydrogenobacter thermophilus]QWK20219.1 MAG: acetoin utilization protein AcuC [Hydrogenobacter thermophilus]